MARIELKYCTVRMKDGLSGTGLVNQPTTPPTVTDTSIAIDTVALNSLTPAKVPVGARFTIAGETDSDAVHTVTARTQGSGSGTNAKQNVALTNCTDTFTLTWGGVTTASIAFGGGHAVVKAALVAMDDGYTTSDWDVTGDASPYVVEFKGALGAAPRALMTKIYHLPELGEDAARTMQQSLAQLRGVSEVLVVANEQIALLKVEISGFDEDAVEYLVKGA